MVTRFLVGDAFPNYLSSSPPKKTTTSSDWKHLEATIITSKKHSSLLVLLHLYVFFLNVKTLIWYIYIYIYIYFFFKEVLTNHLVLLPKKTPHVFFCCKKPPPSSRHCSITAADCQESSESEESDSDVTWNQWWLDQGCPGIPTTIKTMGVNITTIVYLRVLIIQIGSTIVLMVVEA